MKKALLLALLFLTACETEPKKPENAAFIVFQAGTVGRSNDPLKFPKPGIAVMVPYSQLQAGMFVNRLDRIGYGHRFVLHQLIALQPDGSWLMQGYNRVTNPKPDRELLTPDNYWGVSYPLNPSDGLNAR